MNNVSNEPFMYAYEREFLLNEAVVGIPVPKCKTDLVPSTLLIARSIGNKESTRVLKVLFDSGGSNCLIHESVLPLGATKIAIEQGLQNCQTAAGDFNVTHKTRIHNCILPEFDRSKRIYGTTAMIFNAACSYDIIIGRDFLRDIGVVLNFKSNLMHWMDNEVKMKPRDFWQKQSNFLEALELDDPYDRVDDEPMESYIMDAKYERQTPKEIVEGLTHLNATERDKLEKVLSTCDALFDGTLGHYTKELVHLELEPDAVPVHSKAYSVPKAHEEIFKKELQHLNDIGVLRPCGPTEWAAPTFIVAKKDGRVRWLTDFRILNQNLKRKQYPLPLIHDIVARRKGYKYFTKIDLSMMYYAFELDEASKELCTIVTPFGKFQYNRLAMGLKVSPDVAQHLIEKVLTGLDVEVYIDDVGIFSDDYDEHLQLVAKVLQRLEANGLKTNPLKCEWAVQETDFLGHWLTPEGVKPWKKKVDAVLKLSRPTNVTELRAFLGAVTYYRNMWPRRSHLLSPLTHLTGASIFEWTPECDKAFAEMKAIMANDAICVYPNHNLPFDVYTDASDYQMGAVILQQGRPVAYWSKKLNAAQKNYSVMEKEMLSVVMCLKEFRSMLYGTDLTVHTDHKNLTFRTLNTQRVLRWRMFLEEFAPTFKYCPGKDNVLADCFSRLPRMDKPTEGKSVASRGKEIAFQKLQVPKLEDELYHYEALVDPPSEEEMKKGMPCRFSCCRDDTHDITKDDELLESYLNHPALEAMPNPITILNIQQHQFEDQRLDALARDPVLGLKFPIKEIQGRPLICYRTNQNDPEGLWRIALPVTLLEPMVNWYHQVLGHCGSTRLYETISRRFWLPGLRQKCIDFQCGDCQKNKLLGAGYGLLPPRHAPLIPWNEVAVDLIGPWKIKIEQQEVEFNALTCIDPVTNLVEIIRIENRTAAHIAQQFENCWLSRYPRPNRCVHDNGGEFIGWEFQVLLQQHGIQDVPTTSRNPQANAVCERMHQTVANVLRTTLNSGEAPNLQVANQAIENALATTVYATRCSVSRSLGCSPGELVFQRDMLLDLPVITDLLTIQEKRQVMIDENLRRQNQKRREYRYEVGGEVLIKTVNPSKLEARAHGPYVITRVYTNGTLDVRRNAQVVERLNIRRVVPFRRQ